MNADRYWSFEGPPFIRHALAENPRLALLWKELHGAKPLIDQRFLTQRGLRALPLIEGWVDPRYYKLFDILRESGSSRGYFLAHPEEAAPADCFREFALDDKAMEAIEARNLFEYTFLFTDDRANCVILTWHTDFTLLCMKPAIFDRLLQRTPMCFTLDGEGPEARRFHDALVQAFERYEMWGRDPQLRPQYEALSWQLVRAV